MMNRETSRRNGKRNLALAAAAVDFLPPPPLCAAFRKFMAQASAPNRLLRCTICHEDYTDPRLLPCSHTFCSSCIDVYVDDNVDQERFTCPQCRQTHKDIEPDLLPRNDFVAALVRAKALLQRQCGLCKTLGLILQACADCKADICIDCASRHSEDAQTRAHRVTPVKDVNAGLADQKLQCDSHGKPLEYHCRQCDRAKCQECARSCERHDIRSFADAAGDARRRLDGLICRVQESKARTESTASESNESWSHFLKMVDRVASEAESRYHKFAEALSQIRGCVMAEIDLARNECAAVAACNAAAAGCSDYSVAYCQRLLEVGRAADVVCQCQTLAEHLKQVISINSYPVPCPSIQLIFDKQKDVFDTLKTLFGGTYVKTVDAQSPQDDDGQLSRGQRTGSLTSVFSVNFPGKLPQFVCEIEVPHHVNGIVATGEKASVLLATKGVRVYNMAARTLPSDASGMHTTSETPGIVVSDEDGSQVRSLTTLRTVAGREVFDTGGDETRSFCVKTRFLHAALLSCGFIVTTNDTKKSLTVYTPNGIVAAESHVPKSKGPWGVAVASGDKIILADCDAGRVTVHDSSGHLLVTIDKDPSGKAYFGYPCFVAARESMIVVSDVNKHRVLAFDISGRHLWKYGARGSNPVGELYRPEGVCMDEFSNVYIAENGNSRITVLSSQGVFKRTLLSGEQGLQEPFSIAINRQNELFVLERAISNPAKPMKIKLFSLFISE